MVNFRLLEELDKVFERKTRTIIMGVINLSLDSFSNKEKIKPERCDASDGCG